MNQSQPAVSHSIQQQRQRGTARHRQTKRQSGDRASRSRQRPMTWSQHRRDTVRRAAVRRQAAGRGVQCSQFVFGVHSRQMVLPARRQRASSSRRRGEDSRGAPYVRPTEQTAAGHRVTAAGHRETAAGHRTDSRRTDSRRTPDRQPPDTGRRQACPDGHTSAGGITADSGHADKHTTGDGDGHG